MANKFYRWLIEVEVADHCVADGLDFVNVTPHDALMRAFPLVLGSELRVRVVEAPDTDSVAVEQGFAMWTRPTCGHSVCSQNFIDTGDPRCVEGHAIDCDLDEDCHCKEPTK